MKQIAFLVVFGCVLTAMAAPTLAADEKAPKTLRVYFVGNSVTDTINYTALAELATRGSGDGT